LLEQFESQGTSGKILLLHPGGWLQAAAQRLAAGSEPKRLEPGWLQGAGLSTVGSAPPGSKVITDGLFSGVCRPIPALAAGPGNLREISRNAEAKPELALVRCAKARPRFAPELRFCC